MKRLWVIGAIFVFCSFFVHAQDDARPIVRVGERTLTTRDLEHVKTLLPFERFKTTPGKSRLIDALYLKFMVARTQLEGSGMAGVTQSEIVERSAAIRGMPEFRRFAALGYTPEALAERGLVVKKYIRLASERSFSTNIATLTEITESMFTSTQPTVQDASDRERKITQDFAGLNTLSVTAYSMLLPDLAEAQRLASRIRSQTDFRSLARQHSLVRRTSAGQYTDDLFSPSVNIADLEPELQIAVLSAQKPGLLQVAAPFGRAWLVWVSKLERSSSGVAKLAFRLLITDSFEQLLFETYLGETPLTIQWLDAAAQPPELVVARIGAENLDLTTILVSQLFSELNLEDSLEDLIRLQPDSFSAQITQAWLEERVIRQGLPFGGAGTEQGLEAYLAARATVSEAQLKDYYWTNRLQYAFRKDLHEVPCEFSSLEYARQWRDVVLFVPFVMDGVSYDTINCDIDGGRGDLPLPKLTKASLTPVASGFVTPVFKFGQQFAFVILYGYHPDNLIKPFVLVRGEVNYKYRQLVAQKQVEAFRTALYKRTGAQNLLRNVIAQLEQP